MIKSAALTQFLSLNQNKNGFETGILKGYKMDTRCHSEGFRDFVVPHLRLFLNWIKMPLESCVATENDLTALFKNED